MPTHPIDKPLGHSELLRNPLKDWRNTPRIYWTAKGPSVNYGLSIQ
jgi:hypothetical protein